MIRINLLKGRPGSNAVLPPALDASGTQSRFLTKREMILAVALVVIGGGIIAAQLLGVFRQPPSDDEPLVATYGRPKAPRPAAPPVNAPAVEAAPTVPAQTTAVEVPPPSATPASAAALGSQPPGREFGAEPAHAIVALDLVPWGQAIEILARVQGLPEYRSFWLTNPDRLVIDIENAELRVDRSELSRTNPHPLIRGLRAAQNSFEPPRVRIVVETGREGPVEVTSGAAGISVKLSPTP